jgi:hypothetical protein
MKELITKFNLFSFKPAESLLLGRKYEVLPLLAVNFDIPF